MPTLWPIHRRLTVALLAAASFPVAGAFAFLPGAGHAAELSGAAPQERPDFSGTWIFADDITPNRSYAGVRPAWGTQIRAAQTADALTFERGPVDAPTVYRHPFDGTETQVTQGESTTTFTASWEGDRLRIESRAVRQGPDGPTVTSQGVRRYWLEGDALMAEAIWSIPYESTTLAVYRHPPAEPPPPAPPAQATIADIAWLAGNWPGYRPTDLVTTEIWGPPAGNAMLGTSSTAYDGEMVAFEFLRIIEREGTLVYIPQPGGGAPTEFTLTAISPTRAVFENPEHDFPKTISYTLGDDGILRARISDVAGLLPQEFWYQRGGG